MIFSITFLVCVVILGMAHGAAVNIDWSPSNAPYASIIVYPQDKLTFTFPATGSDTVWLMSRAGFDACDFSSPAKANETTRTTATITLTDNPPFPKFYGSQSGCASGQKIRLDTMYKWTPITTQLINRCSELIFLSNTLIDEVVNLVSSNSNNCQFFTDSICDPAMQTSTAGSSFGKETILYIKCAAAALVQTVTASGPGGALNGVQTFQVVDPLVATISSKTNVLCYGDSTGAATITVTGGYGNHTYTWTDGGAATASRSGFAAGTYNVTITDGMQTTKVSVVITQPAAPLSFTSTTHQNPTCYGTSGTLGVVVAGGATPYTYLWDGGFSTTTVSVGVGNYSMNVTDNNGCRLYKSFVVTEPDPLAVTTVKTDALCFGSATGIANATATGGTSPYTYSWTDSSSTDAFALGLTARSYTVTVTDSCSATATSTIAVGQPTAVALTVTSRDVSCFGGNNGRLEVTASGGTPRNSGATYTYSWNNGVTSTTNVADTLTASDYTVVATDAQMCTAAQTYTISQPTVLAVKPSSDSVRCHGGSDGAARVAVSGGTGPYTYAWSPSISSTTNEATGLATGTYTAVVTDDHMCQHTEQITVAEPPLYQLTSTYVNVSCFGEDTGSATVAVTGGTPGYTYSWTAASDPTVISTADTAPSLFIGSYSVAVLDAHNCPLSQSFTIRQPDRIVISTSKKTNVKCNGGSDGSVTVKVVGGVAPYSYDWTSGSTAATATDLNAADHILTLTDANLCVAPYTVTITEPDELTSIMTITDALCHGSSTGTAFIDVAGGVTPYTYTWAPNSGSDDGGLFAGDYNITVVDSNMCVLVQQFTIREPTSLEVTTSQQNVSCHGSSDGAAFVVEVLGGVYPYNYTWGNDTEAGNSTEYFGLLAGLHNVTITDSQGCLLVHTFDIIQPEPLSAVTSQTDVKENGKATGAASVSISGGTAPYAYLWSSGSTLSNTSNLIAGRYELDAIDANNCTINTHVVIAQPPPLIVTTNATIHVACNGASTGAADSFASGGAGNYTYLWSTGATTASASNLPAGEHMVSVTDANGVVRNASVTILEPEHINATITLSDNFCPNSSDIWAFVNATGGVGNYSYAWWIYKIHTTLHESKTSNASDLNAGHYRVIITDENRCSLTVPFDIEEPEAYCQNEGLCIGNMTCNCTEGWEGSDCSAAIVQEDNGQTVKLGVGIGVGVGVPVVAGAIAAVLFATKATVVAGGGTAAAAAAAAAPAAIV